MLAAGKTGAMGHSADTLHIAIERLSVVSAVPLDGPENAILTASLTHVKMVSSKLYVLLTDRGILVLDATPA